MQYGNEEAQAVVDMVAKRAWVPLAALVVGLIVRLLKSDTKVPIDVPPRVRVWLALGLGVLSGVLEAVATGRAWGDAIVGGVVSAALAILGQNVVIDSLRGGRELTIPGLIKPGVPPGPGKPPSIRPPPASPGSSPGAPGYVTPSGSMMRCATNVLTGPARLLYAAFGRARSVAPLVVLGYALLVGAAVSCSPSRPPAEVQRDAARASILLIAEAVSVAAIACADAIDRTQSHDLADKCKAAYSGARSALLAAEASIDAYDAGAYGQVGCAIKKATRSLSDLSDAMAAISAPPPLTVRDAVTLGHRLGFTCLAAQDL